MALPSLGVFGLNQWSTYARDDLARLGGLAEELGYDSIWMGEHVVVPDPHRPPSPLQPDEPILDSLVALAFLAGHTETIRLATGIVILPQRNPLVLAKQLASLDVLSGGRLVFGMGVGYLEPEMTAIGVPMERRGKRAEEYLTAMRSLWEDERPAFSGEFARFEGVNAHPRPLQRPLPVIMGGHTPAAHRRAARMADGWYGFFFDLENTAAQVESVHAALDAAGRDRAGFEISITPRGRIDDDALAAYADLGVDRLILMPRHDSSPADVEALLRAHAPAGS